MENARLKGNFKFLASIMCNQNGFFFKPATIYEQIAEVNVKDKETKSKKKKEKTKTRNFFCKLEPQLRILCIFKTASVLIAIY